jgi:glycosyltransferase involved in cell wall biosynthesis
VVLSLDPGGTERLVVDLATRLDGEMPMRVCCLDRPGAWAAELEARGITVDTIGRQPGFRPSIAGRVAAIAREHGATVIHAHHYSPFVYGGLTRLWQVRVPVIFTEHGRVADTPPSRKRRAANLVLSRLPHRVFAVSEQLKQHMVGEGFPAQTIDVIYNGIAVGPRPGATTRAEVRRELGADASTFVIGTIARLDPVKDLGSLIAAVGAMRHAATDGLTPLLVIVGDGPERARLTEVADRFEVGSFVRFLGHRDDARRWLAGCDAYVNCSTSEGVSLTILEAMAAGLPMVATAVGGTPEVVDDTCAILVPARDADRLRDGLADLAADVSRREALGLAGRARVETRFTIERMVSAYRDVYNEVA